MNDDIQLPPLPIEECLGDTYGSASMHDYGRACYEAGLAASRAKQARPAKPEVHRARLSLAGNGDWSVGGDRRPGRINILIHWTDDGRVWIESNVNRVLAQKLRANGYLQAADALDGGVR